MVTLVNKLRVQNGVGPVAVSIAMQNASQWMATDMATFNYYTYRDSLRRSPGTRLAAFGYTNYWGEDLGSGFADAQNILIQWLSDCTPDTFGNCTYSNKKFLLDPYWVVMGVGRANNTNSQYGWYWVIDMGQYKDATISPGSTPVPVLTSFDAVPSTINSGSSATLSWTVSGATTVTIDNGVGDVSNTSFKSVTPSKTTTYTLTATNAGGSSTAKTSIIVNLLDNQPPTAPALISALAKNSGEVDLGWSASTDNVAVTGYQIVRNNSEIAAIAGSILSFSDVTVAPNTSYIYAIRAVDAAGNLSAASNSMPVTTPPPPAISSCPTAGSGVFTGCYFSGITLSGTPTKTTSDAQLMFDWSNAFSGRPNPMNNFSVRWQGTFNFAAAGNYSFTSVTSDGMRVYVDGALGLDSWKDQPPSLYTFNKTLTAGSHLIVVEFYSKSGWPISYLWWSKQ